MPLIRGDIYTGFEISRFLGSGATGVVYLARDRDAATWVALKIMRAALTTDTHFRRRLHVASRMVADLANPGVARVLDFGESQGRLWVATEYVNGLDADHLLHQRFPAGMSHRGACVIAGQMAGALDAAHRRQLFHGDVKPTNVLIESPFSENYRILLTDFGQGDIRDPEAPRFAAPEVLAGGPQTARSDQFALAATVFQLLTAAPAFHCAERATTDRGHVRFDAGALNDSPTGLERVFATAFASDPAARFVTCQKFVLELSTRASDSSAPRRASRLPRRRRVLPEPPVGDPTELRGAVSRTPDTSTTATAVRGSKRSVLLPAVAALVIVVALTVAAVALSKPRPVPVAATPSSSANQAAPTAALIVAEAGCAKLDAAVANFSLRQKLAQLLMVGVKDIDDARAVVNGSGVGGIMIASWTNLSMLGDGELHDLQTTPGPLPLAVSVDEEGGRVQRLKNQLGDQPSPRVLAQTDTPDEVRQIAFHRGTQMRGYGITVDFAPVVDVTEESDDQVIGDRSFGSDPAKVTEYAGAYAQGLRDAGLLPVLKHFPGHGHGSGDSHLGDVTTPSLSDLKADDLVPYQKLSVAAPVAVMVGHLEVPNLTTDQPTSLTPAAYSLLRTGDYGGPPFDGLIFTDDLSSMKAISNHFGVAEAALRALQAGADVALWTNTDQVPAVLDGLVAAINANELDINRVNDALRHVAAAKDPELACTH
jgi:beta-glucosidase-like glycosyl hydrolase